MTRENGEIDIPASARVNSINRFGVDYVNLVEAWTRGFNKPQIAVLLSRVVPGPKGALIGLLGQLNKRIR